MVYSLIPRSNRREDRSRRLGDGSRLLFVEVVRLHGDCFVLGETDVWVAWARLGRMRVCVKRIHHPHLHPSDDCR